MTPTTNTLAGMTLDQLKTRARLNADRGIQTSQALRDEIARREAEIASQDDNSASAYVQTIPSDILAAAARGEIDLNKIARAELANRGLNWQAKWVGFPEAARIAKMIPTRGPKGNMIAVSIPE